MNIAITGHTSGLGALLKERYEALGHNVQGFSRSNGFELTLPGCVDIAVRNMVHPGYQCDIVFNNAPGFFQRDVFWQLVNAAHVSKPMVIVNISSFASRYGPSKSPLYASDKAALDSITMSYQLSGQRWPAALLVRPGYFTGKRSEHKQDRKVDVERVADIIMMAADAAYQDQYRINEITIQK